MAAISSTAPTVAATPLVAPVIPLTIVPDAKATGQLDALSAAQAKSLEQLRAGLVGVSWTLDDHELLRFLRAHKWDVAKAVAGLKKYHAWREENKIDRILDGPPPRAEMLRRCVASAFHGFDKEGRPIYIEKTGRINADVIISTFTDDEIAWGHIWGQENQARRARESSARLGRNVETFTTIMDLTGLNNSHKKCVKFTKALSESDSQNYPERLGRMYVINAPWIFPILYSIVKRWLDPVTTAKIVVVKGDPKTVLLEHIAADQLPSEYGGTCNTCELQPDCVKVYDIAEFQKSVTKDDDTEFQTQIVAARSKWELKLEGGVGATFTWYFKTIAHDISFSVEFEPKGAPERKWIVNNAARFACHTIPVQGEFVSKEAGTLILIFDNTFSWFSAKTVNYVTTVIEGVTHAGVAVAPVLPVVSPSAAEGVDTTAAAPTPATGAADTVTAAPTPAPAPTA